MSGEWPLWGNVLAFVTAAVVVWFASTRVVRYADAIEARTGIGEALIGMLLLGVITSLPEVATTVTASYAGNPPLAINNLLGSVAMNTAILAAADAAVRREALSSAVASSTPLLQGVFVIVLLAVVTAVTVVGDHALIGIGIGAWLLLALYIACLVTIRQTRNRSSWVPQGVAPEAARHDSAPSSDGPSAGADQAAQSQRGSLRVLIAKTAVGATAILGAGYALAQSGDAIAAQTGLGASFFGAAFLSLSTSLTEITVVFSSVMIGRYAMAVSNVFGASLFCPALIFVADAVYGGEPVLAQAGPFASVAALLGIVLTALYLAGLLERSHVRVGRMGIDSLIVLVVYAAGLTLLYQLR